VQLPQLDGAALFGWQPATSREYTFVVACLRWISPRAALGLL
jgi:hypothetical protein